MFNRRPASLEGAVCLRTSFSHIPESIHLTIELANAPDPLPARWAARGNNALRLRIQVSNLWLELNKIGVWLCGWEVLEVVVEGAVGDVGGEGREGFLRGVALEVGDVVLGGVPHVFRGVVVGGVGWQVDGCYAFQGLAGGVEVGQGPGVVEPGVVQDDGDLLSLVGLSLEAAPS